MATAFANFASNGVLTVDAVADQIIRVRRVLVTSDVSGQVELRTDYGGDPSSISPILYVRQGGSSVADLRFERESLNGARGKNVALVTTIAGNHGVLLEYDLVN